MFDNLKVSKIMCKVLLALCLLIFNSFAIITGTCVTYDIDLQTCKECIPNFHLFQGNCYQDIVGCKSYIGGNICQQCEKDYLMVNNLCCDHNCLAKVFKRSKTNVKPVLQTYTEILNKIIPEIKNNLMRSHISNMVEIEAQKYQDVTRFVFLFEFYHTGFSKKRVIIDYVQATGKIIYVDESDVKEEQNYLNFHVEEIPLESLKQKQSIIKLAFNFVPEFQIVKVIRFSNLNQYEVVANQFDAEVIHYKTFYIWQEKYYTLQVKKEPLPEFIPSEQIIEGQRIIQANEENESIKKVIAVASADPSFIHSIHKIVIHRKTRFRNEYMISVLNEKQKGEIYLMENTKIDQITLLESNIEEIKQEVKEEVVEQIVVEVIQEVKNEYRNEEKQQDKVKDSDNYNRISNMFQIRQSDVQNFEILEIWNRRGFRTFTEITALIKVSSNLYYYLFAHLKTETGQLMFDGMEMASQPKIDDQGNYLLPNKEQRIEPEEIQELISIIQDQFPDAKHGKVIKIMKREFPENKKRYMILIRHLTSEHRYVLIQNGGDVEIQEATLIKDNLPKLTDEVEKEIEVKQEIQQKVQKVASEQIQQIVQQQEEVIQKVQKMEEQKLKLSSYQEDEIKANPELYEEVKKIFKSQNIRIDVRIIYLVIKEFPKVIEYIIKVEEEKEIDGRIQKVVREVFFVKSKEKQQTRLFNDEVILLGEGGKQEIKAEIVNEETLPQNLKPQIIDINEQVTSQYFEDKPLEVDKIMIIQEDEVTKVQEILIDPDSSQLTEVSSIINKNGQPIIESVEPLQLQPVENVGEIQITKVLSCFSGNTNQCIRQIPHEQQVIINQLLIFIIENNIQVEQIQIERPIDFVSRDFCSHLYVMLYYEVEQQMITLSFSKIHETNQIQYLGKRVFHPKGRSHSQIIRESFKVSEEFDQDKSFEVVKQVYPELSQQSPLQTRYFQFGHHVIVPITFGSIQEPEFTRYIVNHNLQNGQSTVDEFCKVKNKKQSQVIEKVGENGHKIIETNDIIDLINSNSAVSGIIEFLKQERPNEIDIHKIVNIKLTDFKDTVEYVIIYEATPTNIIEFIVLYNKATGQNIMVEDTQVQTVVEEVTKKQYEVVDEEMLPQVLKVIIQKVRKAHFQDEPYTVEYQMLKQEDGIIKYKEIAAYQNKDEKVLISVIVNRQGQHTVEEILPVTFTLPENENDPVEIIVKKVVQEMHDVPLIVNGQEAKEPLTMISFTVEEAHEFLIFFNPEFNSYTIKSSDTKILPHHIEMEMTLVSPTGQTKLVVLVKDEHGNVNILYNEKEEPLIDESQKLIKEMEMEDFENYVPVNPYTLTLIQTVKSLIEKYPVQNFQKEIDLGREEEVDTIGEITVYLRATYSIVKKGDVIRVIEDLNTKSIKKYEIYFYVKEDSAEPEKVYKVHIEYNQETPETRIKVLSFTLVFDGNQYVDIPLEQNEEQEIETSIAYGFQKISLTDAARNQDIADILQQLELKYGHLIKDEKLLNVETLELKNGKVNYIFKYKSSSYVVFYDSILQKVILLNAIAVGNQSKYELFSPEQQQSSQYFRTALKHLLSLHPLETQDHTINVVSKYENEGYVFFKIELTSSGKSYKSQIKVLQSDAKVVEEISWTQTVQISLDHFRLDSINEWFVTHFKKINPEEEESPVFKMANEFARNQNQLIVDAHFMGGSSKPQNLGFVYKMFYRLESSELAVAEVYAESSTQKMKSMKFYLLDFTSDFVTFSPEGQQTQKILKLIEQKINSSHQTKDFAVTAILGKDFLYGNLFKLEVQVVEQRWQAIIYHDHETEEIHLIKWALMPSSNPCKVKVSDQCEECSKGYFMDLQSRKCHPEISNCQEYREDKLSCRKCADGFKMVNKLCTSDCGPLCR